MKNLLKYEKNGNLNQHVISRLSGNPAECKSLLNIMPLDSRVKPENDREMGRSMVEMLGVLAVMGVLSVAGIAGFNSAMNRHRANEILNEASKRATVVAAQAMMGRTGTISLGEFGNNSVSGATFGASATIENNQIKLTLSGIADPVCAQMKTALGENSIMAVDDKCTKITFNADMSRGVTVRGTSTADGWTGDKPGSDCTGDTKLGGTSGCQVCVDSSYVDSDAKCESGQTCVDGTCTTPTDSTGTGCLKNSDCETIDPTNCSGGKCFCGYHVQGIGSSSNVDCQNGPKAANGTCLVTANYSTSVSATTDGITGTLSTKEMDWFSAKNFCQANGRSMISLSDSGINVSTLGSYFNNNGSCYGTGAEKCEGVTWSNYKGELASTYWWTKDLTEGANSCNAFNVGPNVSFVDGNDRNIYIYALCK